ncbi:hypothetical protein SDC9_203061 [bioreactor metagenome]|uniref:Uncharacterized protein n=1 Tax=bioreactor metagenome TaxID=1076179 RepID=A0A645IY63_9ZZZZ
MPVESIFEKSRGDQQNDHRTQKPWQRNMHSDKKPSAGNGGQYGKNKLAGFAIPVDMNCMQYVQVISSCLL